MFNATSYSTTMAPQFRQSKTIPKQNNAVLSFSVVTKASVICGMCVYDLVSAESHDSTATSPEGGNPTHCSSGKKNLKITVITCQI